MKDDRTVSTVPAAPITRPNPMSLAGQRTNPLAREGAAARPGVLHLPQQPFERAQVTGGRSVLRIEGFKHSNLKTGAPNEREAHQPAAPTPARRHEHAPVRARYATRVHPCCQEARELSRPRAGYGRA